MKKLLNKFNKQKFIDTLNKFKTDRRYQLVTATLLFVIVCGVVFVLITSKKNQPDEIFEFPTVTHSTNEPDEEPIPDDYDWFGGPEDPKYIRIPTISTEGFIQRVGVDQNREVAVPTNVHLAGWFIDTVKPGQNGLSIIDGHVDGRTTAGIFRNLEKLKNDDEFTIELGSGEVKQYRVLSVNTYDKDVSVNYLFSQHPRVKSQLNLITCGGIFDSNEQTYSERIIVAAELIE